jgi:hypothetical protein
MNVSRQFHSALRARARARNASAMLVTACITLVAFAIPGAAAGAEQSQLTIERPLAGAMINSSTPSFQGTTTDTLDDEEVFDPITLIISDAGGAQVQRLAASTKLGEPAWSAVAEPLLDGTYTAQAIQTAVSPAPHAGGVVGKSTSVSFTIDTVPPQVTIASPANGSSSTSAPPIIAGAAGTAAGDLPSITVRLFAGPTAAQPAFETLVAPASGGAWSTLPGGLAPGTYTAQAEQRDQAGNAGVSQAITFVVLAPSTPPPPMASFSWFPAAPRAGEPVSLVSSSTDAVSPITAFAWSLSGSGPFSSGKPILTTSFATPGVHVVRLQVTDAAGRSSVATRSIAVRARTMTLMQPFPIVRIAGSLIAGGARIRLLTVQAPPGAVVHIACVGRRCRTKPESRVAKTSKSKRQSGAVLLSFSHFEVSLRAGVTLQIRVTKGGQIGKFTSLRIRRGKLPVRTDACLFPARPKPSRCPAT